MGREPLGRLGKWLTPLSWLLQRQLPFSSGSSHVASSCSERDSSWTPRPGIRGNDCVAQGELPPLPRDTPGCEIAQRQGHGRNDFLGRYRSHRPGSEKRTLESCGHSGVNRAARRRTHGRGGSGCLGPTQGLDCRARSATRRAGSGAAVPQRPLLAGGGGRLFRASDGSGDWGCLQDRPVLQRPARSQRPRRRPSHRENLGDSRAKPCSFAGKLEAKRRERTGAPRGWARDWTVGLCRSQ